MRPLLTEINKSNQNIHSLSLKSFYIQKELSSGTEGDRFVVVDKWLDVEFERFSFSVMDDDSISYSLVKTSYHTIKQLYFDSRTLTMKVGLLSLLVLLERAAIPKYIHIYIIQLTWVVGVLRILLGKSCEDSYNG